MEHKDGFVFDSIGNSGDPSRHMVAIKLLSEAFHTSGRDCVSAAKVQQPEDFPQDLCSQASAYLPLSLPLELA